MPSIFQNSLDGQISFRDKSPNLDKSTNNDTELQTDKSNEQTHKYILC